MLLLQAGLALMVVALILPARAKPPPPHIVFILADDLGWNDVSFHGSNQIPTPNIDTLAQAGIILNNYYVSPICTPTRSALLTGKHPIHTGMQHDVIYGSQPYGLPLEEKLLSNYLKELGYATHIVGKWHLGFFNKIYTPLYRGFDSHSGYYCGHQDYFDHTAQESTSTWGFDMRRFNMSHWKDASGHYSTELFTAEAVKRIQEHDVSQPLFLYLAHLAVHSGNTYSPLEALPEDIAKFAYIHDIRRRTFAGMMAALDRSVGEVIVALKKKNMLDNSVIVFSTDNGGPANGFDMNAANNWPLKGTKDTLWEGGVRGTAFIWSDLLNSTERVSYQMMHVTDWLPTLVHAAGGTPPVSEIDGIDMWDALSNDEESPRTEMLHNIDDIVRIAALRVGDFKIVIGRTYNGEWDNWFPPFQESNNVNEAENEVYQGTLFPSKIEAILEKYRKRKSPVHKQDTPVVTCGPVPPNATLDCQPQLRPCLFNIRLDPCEFHNIAKDHSDVVTQLMQRLAKYNATAVPPANRPDDPNGDPRFHGYNWDPWIDNTDRL